MKVVVRSFLRCLSRLALTWSQDVASFQILTKAVDLVITHGPGMHSWKSPAGFLWDLDNLFLAETFTNFFISSPTFNSWAEMYLSSDVLMELEITRFETSAANALISLGTLRSFGPLNCSRMKLHPPTPPSMPTHITWAGRMWDPRPRGATCQTSRWSWLAVGLL